MISRFALAAACSLAFTFSAVAEDAAENLVENHDFAEDSGSGKPARWKADGEQTIIIDKDEKPEGAEQSLKVEITTEKGQSQGQILQEIKVDPNKTYKIEATINATAQRVGFVQVKLREGKSEGTRVNTDFAGTEWKDVSKEFSSENADNVLVLLRFNQKPENVGQSCWFANVRLTEVGRN